MRVQQRVLQSVGGVVRVATGHHRQPVELAMMAIEQFLEGIAVAGDVRGQQLTVGDVRNPPEAPHTRTLSTPGHPLLH